MEKKKNFMRVVVQQTAHLVSRPNTSFSPCCGHPFIDEENLIGQHVLEIPVLFTRDSILNFQLFLEDVLFVPQFQPIISYCFY